MALCFALGSGCFLVGPFPGYAQLVGDRADAITFFVGSIFFTLGGALQSWIAWPDRHREGGGRAAWWSAVIQSAGTLFFNVSTFQAMHTALTSLKQLVEDARLRGADRAGSRQPRNGFTYLLRIDGRSITTVDGQLTAGVRPLIKRLGRLEDRMLLRGE